MIGRQNSGDGSFTGASRKRSSNASNVSTGNSQEFSETEPLVGLNNNNTSTATPTTTTSSSLLQNFGGIGSTGSSSSSPMANMVTTSTQPAPQSGNHTLLRTSSNSSNSKNHPRRYPTMTAYLQSFVTSTTSIKFVVLIVLSLQNSLFTVLRRYSQGIRQEMYSKYEVLMIGEVIKLVFSSYMIQKAMIVDNNSNNNNMIHLDDPTNIAMSSDLTARLLYLSNHSGKMIGLAIIYGIMNILSFVALRNIGAGTFTIFAQCKILTTAAFSALILHRHYSITKWRALISLVFGVLLFSEPIWNKPTTTTNLEQESNSPMVVIGIVAVLIEVTLSGFASIYFEKVIKLDPLPLTIWERNFQLALVSSCRGSCCVFMHLCVAFI
jgi:Nucleotide-sugar transporter